MSRFATSLILAGVAMLASPVQAPADSGGMLIEPAELSSRLKEFVILDARSARAYANGHIPGAIHVNADSWKTNFRSGKDTADWSKRIGALGIDGSRPVIVYDEIAGRDAARVWWMLHYWGIGDVRLLNGFWKGWTSAKLPVDRTAAVPSPATFIAKPAQERYASKSKLMNLLGESAKPQSSTPDPPVSMPERKR